MNKTRIVYDMPFAEYAKEPGINASMLRIAYQESLAHVKADLDGLHKRESASLDFGKAFHALALEDREDFVVRPATYTHAKEGEKPWNGNAVACKEWLAANDGAIVLTEDEAARVRTMGAAVHRYLDYPLGGRAEVSVFAEREGVPVKCRIDFLPHMDDEPVLDLKSCESAKPENAMREVYRLGYHIQAYWTLDVLKKAGKPRSEFHFVFVERKYPHAVCILPFRDVPYSVLRTGGLEADPLFRQIAQATQTGKWPDYGIQEPENFVPAWKIPLLDRTA